MLQTNSKSVSSLQAPNGSAQASTKQRVEATSISPETIAKRAYDKFLARGQVHGFDREDWTLAHRELIGEAFAAGKGKK